MKKAILAIKVGMTEIFQEDGSLVPVTVLEAGPCAVTQIRTRLFPKIKTARRASRISTA